MKKMSNVKRTLSVLMGAGVVGTILWLIYGVGGLKAALNMGAGDFFLMLLYLGSLVVYFVGIGVLGRLNAFLSILGIIWALHLLFFGILMVLVALTDASDISYFYLVPAVAFGAGAFWLLSSISSFKERKRRSWSFDSHERDMSLYAPGSPK